MHATIAIAISYQYCANIKYLKSLYKMFFLPEWAPLRSRFIDDTV